MKVVAFVEQCVFGYMEMLFGRMDVPVIPALNVMELLTWFGPDLIGAKQG